MIPASGVTSEQGTTPSGEPRASSSGLSPLPEWAREATLADLMHLSAASERAGDWARAEELYTALAAKGVEEGAPQVVADALRSHARLRRLENRLEEAEELADLSREISMRTGLAGHAARALNMIAAIRHQQHELAEAKELYARALEQARDVGDDTLIGFVCQNLGVIANIEGDLREARALYLESISACLRTGSEANAMMAYNNLGMVCADLGDWMEAEIYFDRGIEMAERAGDSGQLARLCLNRAEPLIEVEEYDRALESLARTEEIARRIRDRRLLGEAARFRGSLARRTGDLAQAEAYLEEAVRHARDETGALELAEATEELARLRGAQGRTEEARAALAFAAEAFREAGAERDAGRVTALLEGASGSSGMPPAPPPR